MLTRDAIQQEKERLKKAIQRDELNIVEHGIGLVADRVPRDPTTKEEIRRFRISRTIRDGDITVEGYWEVIGDPSFGGLPRGYDLDVYNAIMAIWSRGDSEGRLISVGSLYRLLQATGKDPNDNKSYQRLKLALRRLYGVSINSYATVYDPSAKRYRSQHNFRIISEMRLEETPDGQLRRGMLRLGEGFYALLQLRYWKLTDAERYWRLPSTYSRQLFQYLDKHRYRGKELSFGLFHLAKRIGTADETLKRYKPAKLRDVMAPHFGSLVVDGYLETFRFVGFGQGARRDTPSVEVVFRDWQPVAPPNPRLTIDEMATVNTIIEELGDEASRPFYEQRALELGAMTLLDLYEQTLSYCADNPGTAKIKHFAYMVERHRSGTRC